jgi:hypothetical protein
MNANTLWIPIAAAALLATGCAHRAPTIAHVDNDTLPEAVKVPAGEPLKLWTVGSGEIAYECREKRDMPGQHEWAFVAPMASLKGADGRMVGKYYGGPTWEAADGSKVGGKQVAVSPGAAGSIPLQLVKAEPAMGMGMMQGVTYIQRLNTKGGVAPSTPCTAAIAGSRQQVPYEAQYVFYGR